METGDKIIATVAGGGAHAARIAGKALLSAEVEMVLLQAGTHAKAIADASKKLSGETGRLIAEIAIIVQGIISTVRDDPSDYKVIRTFFDHTLGRAREVAEHRVTTKDDNKETLEALDKVLKEIRDNFNEIQKKCFENDAQGAEISAETLSRVMKAHI